MDKEPSIKIRKYKGKVAITHRADIIPSTNLWKELLKQIEENGHDEM